MLKELGKKVYFIEEASSLLRISKELELLRDLTSKRFLRMLYLCDVKPSFNKRKFGDSLIKSLKPATLS